ncbi:hypothetical protein C0971_14755 [Bacillus methanolicus]|nr:hypothetical protein C0971_14755 [Bacillus methanolicus]
MVIYGVLAQQLSESHKQKLDEVLEPNPETKVSPLAWLRQDPRKPSPESFKKVLERLEYLRNLELQVDISMIRPRRLRQLARIGARYQANLSNDSEAKTKNMASWSLT